jgi:hypothetical protein
MNLFVALYLVILFFVLSPGLFFRLIKSSSFRLVVFLHALLFGVIVFLTFDIVENRILMATQSPKEGLTIQGSVDPNFDIMKYNPTMGVSGNIKLDNTNIPITVKMLPNPLGMDKPPSVELSMDDKALKQIRDSLQKS